MYAGVVDYRVKPGRLEEAATLWSEEAVPVAERLGGYRGGLFLGDPRTGRALGIGLWESEAAAMAFEATGALSAVLDAFRDVLAEPATRKRYEVLAADRLSVPAPWEALGLEPPLAPA